MTNGTEIVFWIDRDYLYSLSFLLTAVRMRITRRCCFRPILARHSFVRYHYPAPVAN